MNTREKFRYMAFGGALVFLGMVGAMMSPLTAEKDKFGEIECRRLTVVDADGKMGVLLTTTEHGTWGECLCLWQGREIRGVAQYH